MARQVQCQLQAGLPGGQLSNPPLSLQETPASFQGTLAAAPALALPESPGCQPCPWWPLACLPAVHDGRVVLSVLLLPQHDEGLLGAGSSTLRASHGHPCRWPHRLHGGLRAGLGLWATSFWLLLCSLGLVTWRRSAGKGPCTQEHTRVAARVCWMALAGHRV